MRFPTFAVPKKGTLLSLSIVAAFGFGFVDVQHHRQRSPAYRVFRQWLHPPILRPIFRTGSHLPDWLRPDKTGIPALVLGAISRNRAISLGRNELLA